MGLTISHGCWDGTYSSFGWWREELAQVAGVPWGLMEGVFKSSAAPADEISRWLPLRWSVLRPDVLHVLLSHSDYQGSIGSEDCAPLADRLEGLLPALTGSEDRRLTRRFIDGLRLAASRGEDVQFG